MARVLIDLDPRLLAQLRALANRRGATVDQAINEVLRAGLPAARRQSGSAAPRPVPVSYDYDDVEDDVEDDLEDLDG